MTKEPLTRQALADIVLGAIRSHAECREVKEIGISLQEIVGVGRNWHVTITDAGSADIEIAFTVARRVQQKFNSIYKVVD
jgi:hypothetical protein